MIGLLCMKLAAMYWFNHSCICVMYWFNYLCICSDLEIIYYPNYLCIVRVLMYYTSYTHKYKYLDNKLHTIHVFLYLKYCNSSCMDGIV